MSAPAPSPAPRGSGRLPRWLGSRWLVWVAVALGVALTLPSAWLGRSTDDYVQQLRLGHNPGALRGFDPAPLDLFTFASGAPAQRRALMDEGVFSWWTPPGFRLAFWRPLSAATHVLDDALWPHSPALAHLHSVAWFALLLVVVGALYRRLWAGLYPRAVTRWLAGLALLLYALDDAHGPTVGFLANRNALVAAVFSFAALLAHDRWRRAAWRPGAALGPLLFGAGLLAGESSLAILAYLGAYVLLLDPAPTLWRRARATAAWAAVAVAWYAAYKLQGYGTLGSGVYLDPAANPAAYASAAATRVPVLLLGQQALPWSDLWLLWPPDIAHFVLSLAVSVLLTGLWLLWPVLRRDRVVAFWALGGFVAALPIAATFPADRLLIFVGVGGMGQVAAVLALVFTRGERGFPRRFTWTDQKPWWQLNMATTALALVTIHLLISPIMLPIRARTMATVDDSQALLDDLVPRTPDVAAQDLVVVSAPTDGLVSYLPIRRAAQGTPRPAHLRLLSTGLAAADVRRPNARTLIISRPAGFLETEPERMLRAASLPFTTGERVEVPGLAVDVLAVTEDGRPRDVRFSFDHALDDPRYRWVAWQGISFAPWTPPAVGAEATLAAVDVEGAIRAQLMGDD